MPSDPSVVKDLAEYVLKFMLPHTHTQIWSSKDFKLLRTLAGHEGKVGPYLNLSHYVMHTSALVTMTAPQTSLTKPPRPNLCPVRILVMHKDAAHVNVSRCA